MFRPRLDTLPLQQRALWPELAQTPGHFTLYGGTAIALRLGHRQSVDFDFFSTEPFEPLRLAATIPYLRGAVIRQTAANTLTCSVDRGGPVMLSYFGGLSLGQVAAADIVEGPAIAVAAPLDLAGMKMAVVTQRAEAKDYLDIDALLTMARLPLADMLAAGAAIYGDAFNPLIALKALTYHDDPSLTALPMALRRRLATAVKSVDPKRLPALTPLRPRRAQP